jgi:hypothetical protein
MKTEMSKKATKHWGKLNHLKLCKENIVEEINDEIKIVCRRWKIKKGDLALLGIKLVIDE